MSEQRRADESRSPASQGELRGTQSADGRRWLAAHRRPRADGADGYVYLLDRKNDMIISGGMNVYSTEVENVVQACPGGESHGHLRRREAGICSRGR